MVELLAERNGCVEGAQPGHRGIQVQLIPGRSAFKASVDMRSQICGEASARWCGRAMDRTWSAELSPGGFGGDEADEVEDVSQSDPGPDFGEVDAWHVGKARG